MSPHLDLRRVGVALVILGATLPAPALGATTVEPWATTGANPRGIAVDSQGNVFTANYGGNSVTRISANRTSTAQFGGTTGASPEALAIDPLGNVFTANSGGTVTRISANGLSTAQFGGSTGTFPKGIAVDSQGNVFTANYGGNSVTRISANGLITTQFGGAITQPWGLALSSQGNVFTANFGGNSVTRITANGLSTTQFGGTVSGAPIGIAVDSLGNVYTANFLGDSVTRITANGLSTTQFGGTTGDAPQAVAFDPEGNVYTANGADDTVTRISADGQTTRQFGSSTGDYPYAIAVDADGNVFTANTTSSTVTRISPDRGPLGFTSLAFPSVPVGSTASLTVTATNASAEGSVRPTAISATGEGVAITGGTCAAGARIPPLGTCSVVLSWTPASPGSLAGASLVVTYPDGAGSGDATALSGAATQAHGQATASGTAPPPGVAAGKPLVVTITTSMARVKRGQSLRIGIRTKNASGAPVRGVISCITLPANVVAKRAKGARRSGRALCFRVGVLPAGRTATRTMTVRAASPRRATRFIAGYSKADGIASVTAPRRRLVIS